MSINQDTTLNAVIGYPLKHSLSPALHNVMYEHMGLNTVMLAFEQESVEKLKHFIEAMRYMRIELCAVTSPWKQQVMDFLDDIDMSAKELGSVNTIIQRDGKLLGYNTDLLGISATLQHVDIQSKKVLILGAGAMAQVIAFYIKKRGGEIFFHSRTEEKALALAEKFSGKIFHFAGAKHPAIQIIINTTPVGMFPHHNDSPLPEKFLSATQVVFDLIYNPKETVLLKSARIKGAQTLSGLDPLIAQAKAQVRLWCGQDPPDLDYKKFLCTLLNE